MEKLVTTKVREGNRFTLGFIRSILVHTYRLSPELSERILNEWIAKGDIVSVGEIGLCGGVTGYKATKTLCFSYFAEANSRNRK